jgi:APA family basic amino acid/polyamine antiporter
VFGTYYGWNSAAYFCEEVKDPKHSIVRATFIATAIVTLIYVLINLAFLHVLTPAEMASSNLVAADAAARVFGPAADTIVTGISLISLVTLVSTVMMIYARVIYAMARDLNIASLAKVSTNGSPQAGLALTVIASALLATVGIYDLLLAFSVALFAAMGVVVNFAVIAMRRSHPRMERPWKMPFYPLPAIFAGLINLALLVAFAIEDPVVTAQAFILLGALTLVVWMLTRRLAVSALPA